MALIYFYDATELDRQQLTEELKHTDHHWEYVADKISLANCDPNAEAISVFVSSTITREVVDALPRLRVIACRSTGFNNIDLAVAAERDIAVLNVPTYGEATVAEYTFTLLLALTRKLPAVLEAEGTQFNPEDLRGHDLQGRTLGVIGTGHIGQKVLGIANGFGMKVIAHDAFPSEKLQDKYHFTYVGLDELLTQADVVTLHTPYLPATHHIMNQMRLGQMKPGAILVNTARGELVDTGALIEQLDNGHLGGAAIDVVEGETLLNYHEETALLRSETLPEDTLRHSVEISALQKMPNVIISPHNAFNTVEAIGRINQTTAQNIIDYWYGKLPNKVQPPAPVIGKLLVVRHAESEWNAQGRWTGLTNINLSERGFKEAAMFGQALKKLDIKVDVAYCSEQIRTRETLEAMLDAAQQFNVESATAPALDERDYGEYTGKNKWEVEKTIGEEAFDKIRRGWDVPVPGGETLKMVYARVVPFYKETILPQLCHGENVLVVAHGNSIRALMKYLSSISDEDICQLEMPFGQISIYDVSGEGVCNNALNVKVDIPPPPA